MDREYTFTETAQETAESATSRIADAGEQVQEQAGQTTEQLKQRGQTLLAQQKQRAAEELQQLGAAVRSSADKLHQQHDDTIAAYAESLAQQFDTAAGYLRRADLGDLIEDTQSLARRQPELFFGGMFIAGLAIGRFFKASGRPRSSQSERAQSMPSSEPVTASQREPVGAGTFAQPTAGPVPSVTPMMTTAAARATESDQSDLGAECPAPEPKETR